MEWMEEQEYYYEDKPIRLSPERARNLPPKEYRKMRDLAFGSPFSRNNDAQIFYLQAKYMEQFEDDCPYDREVRCYYPTYQSLSMPELRGYFTWRTRLRHGKLERTSLSYAFLYIYELLHQIGSETKEDGLDALIWFYKQYGSFEYQIQRYMKRWIVDYAMYYNVPVELIRDYVNAEFDEALAALASCDTESDEQLFAAILRLSSYHLEKSRAYREYPEVLVRVICEAYRRINARYEKRYERPYSRKLYGNPVNAWYYPFRSAIFYWRKQNRFQNYEYRVSPLQCYYCEGNQWRMERDYFVARRSGDLNIFLRTADRLVREAYGVKPALKAKEEPRTMVRFLSEAIAEQKKTVAVKVVFDLSKLSGIRKSSDTVGQKLMTEEERYVEAESFATGEERCKETEQSEMRGECYPQDKQTGMSEETSAETDCVLSGNELRFLQLLLYGGDLQGFLQEKHLMVSVLAEAVNERLYDEFADTVIEFDGNTPVLVEDYLDDLKGMIPS